MGMLFFCSVSANEFPRVLYTIDQEEVFVEDLGIEEVERDNLYIPKFSKVSKVCLRNYFNSLTYERTGYLFRRQEWLAEDCVALYYYHLSKGSSLFEKRTTFYFQELKRKISNKRKRVNNDAAAYETDYENDSDEEYSYLM